VEGAEVFSIIKVNEICRRQGKIVEVAAEFRERVRDRGGGTEPGGERLGGTEEMVQKKRKNQQRRTAEEGKRTNADAVPKNVRPARDNEKTERAREGKKELKRESRLRKGTRQKIKLRHRTPKGNHQKKSHLLKKR